MGTIKWTKEQEKAINKEGKILVSAAAGSGKTAVLVERIIRTVIDKKVDIDRILVVTFTKAAASEMKERIVKSINNSLEKSDDPYLRKQLTLLKKSNISTLHSFCYSLIRSNFYLLGISPNIKIAADEEIKVLKEEAIKEVLENMYKEGAKELDILIPRYADFKDDNNLRDDILDIITFSESLPFRKKWQEAVLKKQESLILLGNNKSSIRKEDINNEKENNKSIVDSNIFKKYTKIIQDELLYQKYLLTSTYNDMKELGTEYIDYIETIKEDIQFVDGLIDIASNDIYGIRDEILEYTFKSWPRSRKLKCDETENAKAKRDEAKKEILKIADFATYTNDDEVIEDISDTYNITKAIFNVLDMFYEIYDAKKEKQNILDYADLEHLSIQLLYDEDENGNIVFSKLANELKEKFYEVQVDEYQDINLVQESIINAVSKDNVFEVGDVKQSIYGFRNARPDLFISKHDSYVEDGIEDNEDFEGNKELISEESSIRNYYNMPGMLIKLHKNYRSKENVLDFCNDIFETIMNKETGIIAYDDTEKLYYGNKSLDEIPKKENEIIVVEDSKLELENIYTEEELEDIEEFAEDESDVLEEYNKVSKEAIVIAERIKKLREEYSKEGRNLKYSDIVILLRSVKNKADIYEDVLNQMGIPAKTDIGEGYLKLNEVQLLSNYLKILSNPMLDIEFLSVMRSYFGEFEIDEITRIRIENIREENRKLSIYESCMRYLEKEEFVDDYTTRDIKEKIRKFLDKREEYIKIDKNYGGLKVIEKMVYDSNYIKYISLMPNGEYISSNILKYIEKIQALKEVGIYNVKDIVKYLDELQESKVELETKVNTENLNAVIITTIHKSKGLQYPVVILADADKKKNDMNKRADFVYNEEIGLGNYIYNEMLKVKYDSLYRKVISYENEISEIEEEKRILYVALTRAIEKLIIVSCKKDSKEYLDSLRKEVTKLMITKNSKNILHPKYINKSTSYLRNILASVYLHGTDVVIKNVEIEGIIKKELENIRKNISFENRLKDVEYVYDDSMQKEKQGKEEQKQEINDITTIAKKKEIIEANEQDIYRVANKISVSDITSRLKEEGVDNNHISNPTLDILVEDDEKENIEDNISESGEELIDIFVELPKFMQDSKVSAKSKGTLIHSIFEKLPIITIEQYEKLSGFEKVEIVKKYISDLKDSGIITEDEYDVLNDYEIAKIAKIYDKEMYRKIIEANENSTLFKEKNFYTRLDSKTIFNIPDLEEVLLKSNIQIKGDEYTIMQGVIDLYLIEENDIYLIDYKTDRAKAEDMKKRYEMQLKLYEYALKKEYGEDRIVHKYIYSTNLSMFIKV